MSTAVPTDRRRAGSAAVAIALVLAGLRIAAAEIVPRPGTGDRRIRVVRYDPDEVYRLRGIIGYQIDIEFAPDERFVGLGAGDVDGLAFSGVDNHLFLKPKAPDVATNITVLTTKRTYQFLYTVAQGPAAADSGNAMYAVEFRYASRKSAAEEAAQRLDARLRGGAIAAARNDDYWYCGDPALEPVAAWDDGVHTHLRFAANAEMPAIFLRNGDGSESLVNFGIDRGVVILDRVVKRIVVRRGGLTGCIVNKGFRGGGVRLKSKTIAPDVLRTLRRRRP